MILVDANVWLRSIQPSHPNHQVAVEAIANAIDAGETLFITPQIAAESWNVTTRPIENNGMGFTADEAREELTRLEAFFTVLPETADVYAQWKRLVAAHDVKGVKAHDARLVAAMNIHGVTRLMTFNAQDFSRYASLKILTPVQ